MTDLELIEISMGDDLKIADIGCGSGGQTITLAQNIEGQITAFILLRKYRDNKNGIKQKLISNHQRN